MDTLCVYEFSGRVVAKTMQYCGSRIRGVSSPFLSLTGTDVSVEAFGQYA